jgi:glycosyltransferase involved in cell wall biosynthesis
MSLRVVMVSASFSPHVGGAENQALELSLELKRRGHEVRVLTRRLKGLSADEEIRGIPVERLACFGGGALNALTFMVSLAWRLWAQTASYDVIHVHLASSPALAAICIGGLRGKKVVIKIGGGKGIGELALSSRSFLGRLKLLLFRRAQPTFVAVSQGIREEAKIYLGEVPLHEIPNGVDTERFHPATAQHRRECRLSLGWPDGLGFLYTGRFDGIKRLPWFLELWAQALLKSKVPAFLAFVGEGVELHRIEEMRRRLSIENLVLFGLLWPL